MTDGTGFLALSFGALCDLARGAHLAPIGLTLADACGFELATASLFHLGLALLILLEVLHSFRDHPAPPAPATESRRGDREDGEDGEKQDGPPA
jgi:hypothetical protein